MQPKRSNENISDAIPAASPRGKNKTNHLPQKAVARSQSGQGDQTEDQTSLPLVPAAAQSTRLKMNLRKNKYVITFPTPTARNLQLRDLLSKNLSCMKQSPMDL